MKNKIEQWLDAKTAGYRRLTPIKDVINDCLTELQPQWISVNDRLPANTDQYLTMDEKGINAVMTYSIQWGCFVVVAGTGSQATHWQPLPLLPSEELNQ